MDWIEHFRRKAENVDQELAAKRAKQQREAEREKEAKRIADEADMRRKELSAQAVWEIMKPGEEVFQRIIVDFFHGRGSVVYSPLDYKHGYMATSYGERGDSTYSYYVRPTLSSSVKLDCHNPNCYMQLSVTATEEDPKPGLIGEFYAHYYPGRRGFKGSPYEDGEKVERGYNALYTSFKIVESGISDFRGKPSGRDDTLVRSDIREFLEKTSGEAAFNIIRMKREGIK